MRDTEMFSIIGEEEERQLDNIELIASENFVSKEVREAQGSVLTNKYAEGYPGHRYYGGCVYVDKAEQLTKDRALALFGGEFVNVQPHSGAQANMAVYNAILQPGDTVLGMNLTSGGHLTHGSPVNFSGKLYHFISYDVNKETELIDYDEIADKCGAYLMIDMAHIAGLVAAGLHPSPIPYADFVTTTTHKTLRGPRGGMVFCKEEFGKKLNSAVFPGMQGGPLEHVIAAKGVCLFEASQPSFKTYMEQTLKNVQVMVKGFKEHGYRFVSGGSDNHLILVDLKGSKGMTGKRGEYLLDLAGITVNKNTIPFETEKPFVTSGLRIGAAAMTSRGFKEAEFEKVINWIVDVLDHDDEEYAKALEEAFKYDDEVVIEQYIKGRVNSQLRLKFDSPDCHW